jgi:hypothetical protein
LHPGGVARNLQNNTDRIRPEKKYLWNLRKIASIGQHPGDAFFDLPLCPKVIHLIPEPFRKEDSPG